MGKQKESFQQEVFAMIESRKELPQGKVVVPQVLIKYAGDTEAALFLSQLIYWCDKGKSPDGWIYKKADEWLSETGLSRYQVRRAADILVKKGFLQTKLKKANGHPTTHYKFNRQVFADAFFKFLQKESEKFTNGTLKIGNSITESTSYNSSENTKDSKEKHGVKHNELHSAPLSFNEYREKYSVDKNKAEGIRYFLAAYEKYRGTKHPNLKVTQWESVLETLFYVQQFLGSADKFLELDDLKAIIDCYFHTDFQGNHNHSILHFNSDGVKKLLANDTFITYDPKAILKKL
jgi:hypothetical protein